MIMANRRGPWPLRAVGIGCPGERDPRRVPESGDKYLPGPRWLTRNLHVIPWRSRFRFGYVLGWDGLFWHRALGWAGPDFDNGRWTGGMSWNRYGIGRLRMCKWRRRGSLRSDLTFERNMGCHCQHIVLRWFQGRGTVRHGVLCYRLRKQDQDQ